MKRSRKKYYNSTKFKNFAAISTLSLCILSSMPIISRPAKADCTSPAGVSSEMEYDAIQNRYEVCDGTDWIAFNTTDIGDCTATAEMKYDTTNSKYRFCDGTDIQEVSCITSTPNAVAFDGSAAWLNKSSALTGVSDSKLLSMSLWIRTTSSSGGNMGILGIDGPTLAIYMRGSDKKLQIKGENATNVQILDIVSTSTINDGTWHHILLSVDMENSSNRHLYIDGISALAGSPSTHTDDSIDFTGQTFVGGGSTKWDGDMADFWVDFSTYIDFSVLANREKFYNSGAVGLGSDGSLPTGTSPDVFLSGNTSTWHTNKGTGAGFTENGALTDASTQPASITCKTQGSCTIEGGVTVISDDLTYCDGSEYVVMSD